MTASRVANAHSTHRVDEYHPEVTKKRTVASSRRTKPSSPPRSKPDPAIVPILKVALQALRKPVPAWCVTASQRLMFQRWTLGMAIHKQLSDDGYPERLPYGVQLIPEICKHLKLPTGSKLSVSVAYDLLQLAQLHAHCPRNLTLSEQQVSAIQRKTASRQMNVKYPSGVPVDAEAIGLQLGCRVAAARLLLGNPTQLLVWEIVAKGNKAPVDRAKDRRRSLALKVEIVTWPTPLE
jgi:hypothetical protein